MAKITLRQENNRFRLVAMDRAGTTGGGSARGTLELTDPSSITPAQVLANAVLLISSTVVPVPGTNGETLSTATMPRDGYDLSAETSWALDYLTDQTLHGELILYTSTFPDPTRISAAVLATELNNAASPSILNFRVGGSSLDKLYIQRSEAGSTKYIQVGTPRPGPGVYDLNDVLQWDTVSKHYGTDPAVLTFALPGPTDPTTHKGLPIIVACPQASERTFTYTPVGRSLNPGTPGNAVQWLWDGAAWLVMPVGIP